MDLGTEDVRDAIRIAAAEKRHAEHRLRFTLGIAGLSVLLVLTCILRDARASASVALFFLGILHVFFVFLRKMRDGLVTVW